MSRTYDHVALAFDLDKEPITGVLQGDYKFWTFTSDSPQFLQFVPNGILKSSAGWKNPIPKEIHMLINPSGPPLKPKATSLMANNLTSPFYWCGGFICGISY